MTTGKDPQTADGLGGVHNVTQPRAPVPDYPATAAPAPATPGPVPASDSHMESDPDQIGKVVHTQPLPNASSSDVRVAPEQASAFAAEKDAPPS
ncbi:hypothetical protein [Caulobacter segnis]